MASRGAGAGGGGSGGGGGMKRKRGESGDDGGSRPSPHRPSDLSMAGHGPASSPYAEQSYQGRGRGGRRGGRGGRGSMRGHHDGGGGRRAASTSGPSSSAAPSQPPQAAPSPAPTPAPVKPAADGPVVEQKEQAVQTPQPVEEEEPEEEATVLPYAYDHITDEVVENWKERGHAELVEIGRRAVEAKDNVSLGVLYQEIIRASLDQRIDPADGGAVVKEITEIEGANDGPLHWVHPDSCFLDNVSCIPGDPRTSHEFRRLAQLLVATAISMDKIRLELDIPMLLGLKFVRDYFPRVRARYQTQQLYRQNNYNLLREESEGYSKLITEMFSTSGSVPPNAKEVQESYDHVLSMIGAFDLDVGRVLDVTLDAFAAMLVRNYRFFVKFLRVSTWWPDRHQIDRLSGASLSFPTLPQWALPTHDGFDTLTDEDKQKRDESRTDRDRRFWDEVRANGFKTFFLLGGPQADPAKVAELPDDSDAEKTRKAWVETTGLTPPSGNKVAATILGFKLRFYASDARSATDQLPQNLIYLAALLIKVGFISLVDLYPHLYPNDDAMAAVKERKMKERQERELVSRPGGRQLNALASAGALSDEPVPGAPVTRLKEAESRRAGSAKPEEKSDKAEKGDKTEGDAETKEELPEPEDQKVALLKNLLLIGAVPEALFILGKFPWLMDAFPDLSDHIHRILHHCLSKVYESAKKTRESLEIDKLGQVPDLDQGGVAKGSIRLVDQSPTKVLRWPQLEKYESDTGVEYRYYWDDWNDNVPVCQSVDDVFTLCNTFLNLSGVKIGQDSALLTKLARIGRYSLSMDSSEENRKRWIDLSKRLLVPALSLTRHNSGAIAEVWDLLKQYPLPTRYNIYAEWFTGQVSRMEDMKSAFDQARAETKDVLKRISKTNVKPMARALSKVSISSPGVVFNVALNQIESYDNLVEVIVECARYFTQLGYDVLTWTLMNSLGARGRNRVQADGMLRSKWLNALALFSGKVFRRYSMMNPSPILRYVAHQLRNNNTTDLIVLEELISSMAGIVSDASFNEAQTIAMAGGPLLQNQIMLQLLDRRHDVALRSTSKRLVRSLTEPKLAGPLLVAMTQELQTCIYRVAEDEAFLKVLANLYDETHRVLVQYLDLLRTSLPVSEFNELIPSLTQLIGEFGLDPALAFWISRPSISAEIAQHDERVAAEKKDSAAVTDEKEQTKEPVDVSMGDTEEQQIKEEAEATEATNEKEEQVVTKDEEPTKDEPDPDSAEAADGVDEDTKDTTEEVKAEEPAPIPDAELPWHPVIKDLVDSVADRIPSETWSVLSPFFYFTFWQLSLEDVFVPMASYDEENGRLKRKLMAVNSDRSDLSSRGKEKRDEEKKSITDLQSRLQAEVGVRIAAYQKTRQRINKEKDLWFAQCHGRWDELNVAIIEHCILPRIRLSSIDALYTFKLLKHLHSTGALNFRTVGLFDQFFNTKRLSTFFFICTAQEAENVGKFINELIKDLSRWHTDKSVYQKEAWGPKKDLPGFKAKTGAKGSSDLMDYESFRRILGKWHTNLHNALKTCFSGGEYMHIRNAINVLKAMAANFPVIDWMGRSELGLITDLSKTESREDLKLAAMSLLASLKRREKQWVISQAFMLSTSKPNAPVKPAGSATPEPGSKSALSAAAPEFKPRSSPSTNGTPKPAPITTDRMDVEDGEVNSAGLAPKGVNTPTADKTEETSKPGKDTQSDDKTQDENSADALTATNTDGNAETKPRKSPRSQSGNNTVSTKADGRSAQPDSRPANLPPIPPKVTGNGRMNHNLPDRPDAGPRSQDRRGPLGERHHPGDARDGRYGDHRHDTRHGDYPRETGGHPSRHDRERYDSGWGADRTGYDERYDYEQGPSRESRGPRDERSDRHARERGGYDYEGRPGEHMGRPPREVPPASGKPPRSDRTRAGNGPPEDERGPPGPPHDRRGELQRNEGQPRSGSQRNSRAASPARRDERSERHERPPRDENQLDSRRQPEGGHHPRSRYNEGHGPNFRNDRMAEPSHPQSERLRESFGPGGSRNYDTRTRGGHDDRQPQESRYGRLNADYPAEDASGTRASQGAPRSGPPSGPQSSPFPPSSRDDRSAPNGSAGGRQTRSGGGAGGRSGPPGSSSGAAEAGVHPDRLSKLEDPEGRNAASGSASRPPRNAPPVSPVENRSDKRFQGVNDILQSSGGPPERGSPANTRGRGGRGGGGGQQHPSHSSGGGPPPRDFRSDGPPRDSPRGGEGRPDLMANRSGAGSGGPASRDEGGGRSRDTERRPPRGRDGRSASPRRGQPSLRGAGHDDGPGGRELRSRPSGPGSGGGPPASDRETRRGPPGRDDDRDRRGGPPPPPSGGLGDSNWAAGRRDRGPPPPPPSQQQQGQQGGYDEGGYQRGGGGPPSRGGGNMDGGGSGRKRGRAPVDEGGYAEGPKRSRR